MDTTSNFSENSSDKTAIYIKGSFKKERSYKPDDTAGISNFKKEKAIVRNIFSTPAGNESLGGKFKYTIQQGDDKRLSRDGVLRVYNIDEPIDIPVTRLLGKWTKSHIGVTLIASNGQWSGGEEVIKHNVHKSERGVLIALRQMLRFALA